MPTFETIASILTRNSREICSLPPDARVIEALALMAQNGVAAVLVISDGIPVGIVSAKDFGRRIVLEGRSATAVRVEEIMSSPLITVDAGTDAAEAIAIMTRHHIRHLPVFDQGKLAGIVSMGDLASSVISDQGFAIDHLKRFVGHT